MNRARKEQYSFIETLKKNDTCIFISHKKEDEAAAIELGEYISNNFKYDIYLDVSDIDLREAVSEENDAKIVDSIKKGINESTSIICIISDKTKLSWWVPYEVGIADSRGISIATLKIKDIDDIPSFLKLQKNINSIEELNRHLMCLGRYGNMFSNQQNMELSKSYVMGCMRKYYD